MNSLKTLTPHPILLPIIFCLLGLLLMIAPLQDWFLWRGLESDGQVLAANLLRTEEQQGFLGNTTFEVEYEYFVGLSNHRAEQKISQDLYDDLRLKPQIRVLASRDNPEVARVAGSKPKHAVPVIRGFLIILFGVLIWLIWEYQQAAKRPPLEVAATS